MLQGDDRTQPLGPGLGGGGKGCKGREASEEVAASVQVRKLEVRGGGSSESWKGIQVEICTGRNNRACTKWGTVQETMTILRYQLQVSKEYGPGNEERR